VKPGLSLGKFRFTETGMEIAGHPPLEQWQSPLTFALWCQRASPWWIGDLLNAGDAHFGEMFSQVCDFPVSADQLQRYESVARRVPRENRRASLSWSCHAAVARLPVDRQKVMLDRAEKYGWNSTVLQQKVREEVQGPT